MPAERQPGEDRARVLPQLKLDDLLAELQTRLAAVVDTRDRVQALLEAVVSIESDLELESVLRRIVEAATRLADARYGALGVIGEGARLARFITVGVTEEEIEAIGCWPTGQGILGLLIEDPHPLRLDDLGTHPSSYGFPPNHPPMTSFLGVPLRVRDDVFGNLYLTEKRSGGPFDGEDETIVLALATAAGVAIDNARLYDETQRRARWRRASSEVSTALLSGSTPEAVLDLVATHAKELADADLSVICLPEYDGLIVDTACGDEAERYRGVQLPRDNSGAGRAFTNGEPVITQDLPPDDRGLVSREPDRWENGLYVPLGTHGAMRGVLGVLRRPGHGPITPDITETLQAFANQAAIALEVADRRRDAERLAVFADRDRIARDLHDLIIQRLFAIGMQLEGASRFIDHVEANQRVHNAVDDLDATIREIRGTIYALQAAHADEPGGSVRSRVLHLIDSATEQLGFPPTVNLGGSIAHHRPKSKIVKDIAALVERLAASPSEKPARSTKRAA